MSFISSHRFTRHLFLVILFSSLPFKAQNSPDQTTPVFKAETGLVLVDVVVTDHGARRTSSLDLNPVISPCWKTADPRIAAFNVHSQPSTSPKPVIPAHEELEVKPATYTLRLGVVDRNSRKIGTLDVPLTVLQLAGGPGF